MGMCHELVVPNRRTADLQKEHRLLAPLYDVAVYRNPRTGRRDRAYAHLSADLVERVASVRPEHARPYRAIAAWIREYAGDGEAILHVDEDEYDSFDFPEEFVGVTGWDDLFAVLQTPAAAERGGAS